MHNALAFPRVYANNIENTLISSGWELYKKSIKLLVSYHSFASIRSEYNSKMNALKKLKEIQPSKPYHGFAKLNVGFYQIHSFKIVKNKFGKKAEGSGNSILVELNDEVLFLPQYFLHKLSAEDITELNTLIDNGQPLYLFFGGQIEGKK